MIKEKKNNLIYKFKESFILQILLCVILCFGVILFFSISNKKIDKNKFREYNIVESVDLLNSIEEVKIINDKIILSGYAFMLNRNSSDNLISLFLLDKETNQEIWFKMEPQYRYDLNSYFDCEYDYGNSGFEASVDANSIKKDIIYEVIINIDYKESSGIEKKRKTVSTKQYILNNDILNYHPNEVEIPNTSIDSELLREVFTKGDLRFYQKDHNIYVYQYNKKLYWIATDDFEFEENGNTYIPYLLYTSHPNRLPEDKIKYKYDNLDFFFEQNEYKKEDTSPYRVAIRELPRDYAITHIDTGVYDLNNNKWVWDISFHINIKDLFE